MNILINSGVMKNVKSVSEIKYSIYKRIFSFSSTRKKLPYNSGTGELEIVKVCRFSTNRDIGNLVFDSLLKDSKQYKFIFENNDLWSKCNYGTLKAILSNLLTDVGSCKEKILITIDDSNEEFIREYDNDPIFFTKLSHCFDILFIKNSYEGKDITATYGFNLDDVK